MADLEENVSNAEFVEWQIFHARKHQRQDLEMKMARNRK